MESPIWVVEREGAENIGVSSVDGGIELYAPVDPVFTPSEARRLGDALHLAAKFVEEGNRGC